MDDYNYKWYDCLDDMIRVSKLLPKLEIQICCRGEEDENEWCYIFINGKKSESNDMFIKSNYDFDFFEEIESNYCTLVHISSSDSEDN